MRLYKSLVLRHKALLLIGSLLGHAAYSTLGAATEGDYTYSTTNGHAAIVSFNPSFVGALTVTNTLGGCPVTCIEVGAFDSCTGLTSLTLPSDLADIKADAFHSCVSLSNIVMASGVTNIGRNAFTGCCRLSRVVIPDAVTSIGQSAFSSCSNLSELVLGAGIRTVDIAAFSSCPALVNVTFRIDPAPIYAWQLFRSIKSATIGDEVKSIGPFAFSGCSTLTNVTIGASVTNIDYNAFLKCSALTRVTIPDSVTTINLCAFSECSGMKTLVLGAGLQDIKGRAFSACGALDTVTFLSLPPRFFWSAIFDNTTAKKVVIANNVTSIGPNAFNDCSSLASISIGSGVTNIGDSAFENCASLTNIAIPENVTDIGSYAFSGCSSLTRLSVPDSVAVIGSDAFDECSKLSSAAIGRGVTSIGTYAFSQCPDLTRVLFLGNAPTSVGGQMFMSSPSTVYYLPGTEGWPQTFGGRPTLCWNPAIQMDGDFGFPSGQFAFTITGTTNIPVAVEACTNLSGNAWKPLLTNTLGQAGALFVSDPSSKTQAPRFYRIVWP